MASFFCSSSSTILGICAVVMILILSSSSSSSSTVHASDGSHLGWIPRATTRSACKGTIAECMNAVGLGEEEFDLDSEISRRILATSGYISYGALQRNTVPCSKRGSSYYNCQAGAQSNPYSRGCSAITRCRG
ncbi:protein RALF-like 33 [Quercus lobata]|uniref:Rapid alkalinization factor 1 n=1 Tax=Quercus lobata TaxID=97700 RepID=A0A7N2L6K1_QUELO|nr:protein RALF-like 33 [Quercus lobata]